MKTVQHNGRDGFVLYTTIFLAAMFTLALVVGARFLQNSLKASRSTTGDVQAYNVARAGLTDAISWFKRQATQPVQTFDPKTNSNDPTLGDTNDPYVIKPHSMNMVGIVREFPLDQAGNLYGRYEVGKQTKLTRDSLGDLRNYVVWDTGASPAAWVNLASNQANSFDGVTDVSKQYGFNGKGVVWRIQSQGYVYTAPSTLASPSPGPPYFFTSPRKVLGQIRLQTEIRQLQINEFNAPVVDPNGGSLQFNDTANVFIDGTAANKGAVRYKTGSPNPASAPSTFTVSSGNAYKNDAPDTIEWQDEFGVATGAELSGFADVSVTDVTKLPAQLPQMAITYINPSSSTATFTSSRPLNGGGVLAVDGNLTVSSGSYSVFTGIVYVHGNCTLNSPLTINGTVICTGSLTINSPANNVRITYNPTLLQQVQQQLGQYREARSAVVVTQ